LLSHDDRGPAGGDEAKEVRPQMPWIVDTGSFARDAERLARAGAGPEGPVVGPSGEAGREAPPADAGEEVSLPRPREVSRSNIHDRAGVDVPGGEVAGGDEVAEPFCGIGVKLVVVVLDHGELP
jgi:hypothetical protein